MQRKNKSSVELLREFSLPLIFGVLLALVWANLAPDSYHNFVHAPLVPTLSQINLHFIVNEFFMVFFFGVAAVEIMQACLPGGSLNPWTRAITPLFATVGGVVGPILVYFLVCWWEGNPALYQGFGIPTATDIAMAWLIARFIFGAQHPAISFLLLLAIVDDAIGLIIIAVFYPNPAHPPAPVWLSVVAGAMVLAWCLRKRNVLNFWPYLLLPGIAAWFGLFLAGLHPALALVAIVPFMPAGKATHPHLFDFEEGDDSTISNFEHYFKGFVDFGLFGFGLANAGVSFAEINVLTWNVLASLTIGKTVGIVGFSLLSIALGFALPAGMRRRDLPIVGLVAGVGLTVALFVAGVAFREPELQGAAKMGALLSLVNGFIAFAIARALGIRPLTKN